MIVGAAAETWANIFSTGCQVRLIKVAVDNLISPTVSGSSLGVNDTFVTLSVNSPGAITFDAFTDFDGLADSFGFTATVGITGSLLGADQPGGTLGGGYVKFKSFITAGRSGDPGDDGPAGTTGTTGTAQLVRLVQPVRLVRLVRLV